MGTRIVVHETSFVAQAANRRQHSIKLELCPYVTCGSRFPFSALEKKISSRVKAELGNTKENSISGCIWLYVV